MKPASAGKEDKGGRRHSYLAGILERMPPGASFRQQLRSHLPLQVLIQLGGGDSDHSALVRLLDQLKYLRDPLVGLGRHKDHRGIAQVAKP